MLLTCPTYLIICRLQVYDRITGHKCKLFTPSTAKGGAFYSWELCHTLASGYPVGLILHFLLPATMSYYECWQLTPLSAYWLRWCAERTMSLVWVYFGPRGSAGPQPLRISLSLAMAEFSVKSVALFMWWRVFEACSQIFILYFGLCIRLDFIFNLLTFLWVWI